MRVRKPAYSGMCDFQTELSSTFGTSDVYVKQTINNNIENIQSEARPNSDSSKNSQQTKRKHINMGDFLHLSVSNSQNEVVCFEKKFPKDITIVDLKVCSTINRLSTDNLHKLRALNESFKCGVQCSCHGVRFSRSRHGRTHFHILRQN